MREDSANFSVFSALFAVKSLPSSVHNVVDQYNIGRIFTEFYRAPNVRRSPIPGSGVGLAGVKDLVERFDGELEVTSQEGQGSEFIVRLPLFEEESLYLPTSRSTHPAKDPSRST